jgi:diguanylate cyclase (GGDEF)-like protein/PAS domain S-box-containing protein
VEDKIINLIVIDDSFDREEQIVSKLRTAGYTARSSRAEDEEDLLEIAGKHAPDVVIYFDHMAEASLSLKDTIECLGKNKETQNCPVINVNKDNQPDTVDVMLSGAADAVNYNNIDHLILTIKREHAFSVSNKQVARLKKEFDESEKRCSSLLDSSRDAIAYLHEGMHVYSNQSYLELFGINASEDLESMPILDMVASEARDDFKKFLQNYSKHEGVEKLETSLQRPSGGEFDGIMEFSPARIEDEPCIQIIIRQEDPDADELERKLKILSQKDQLTGLFNRQYCIEKLESTIEDAEKNKYTAALIEVQIDNFDEIKNIVGIVQSDQYIIAAAKALNNEIRNGDVISRYSHDSFLIIALNCDKDFAENYATKLQNAISRLETNINGSIINTTCCIGISLIGSDSPEYNDILARCEKAINEARQQGANHIHTYIPKKGELSRQEIDAKFRDQLTNALKHDRFVLHYQPIISLHGDTEERYEVFVRMETDDNDQLVMPQDFLPAAERIGMSIAIDRWVLFKAIKEFLNKQKQGRKTRFFIKLSASSIKDDTLIDWLSFQVKEQQIPPNTLNFEIKETVAMTNLKSAKALAKKLKDIGCCFVLDDFGASANPLQLLEHVDVDYIRMDRGLMHDLAENTQNQDTIRKITQHATELGKFTIAQHVPDASSLSVLWGLGVNFIQGYFLQEPLPEMEYDFTEMTG